MSTAALCHLNPLQSAIRGLKTEEVSNAYQVGQWQASRAKQLSLLAQGQLAVHTHSFNWRCTVHRPSGTTGSWGPCGASSRGAISCRDILERCLPTQNHLVHRCPHHPSAAACKSTDRHPTVSSATPEVHSVLQFSPRSCTPQQA